MRLGSVLSLWLCRCQFRWFFEMFFFEIFFEILFCDVFFIYSNNSNAQINVFAYAKYYPFFHRQLRSDIAHLGHSGLRRVMCFAQDSIFLKRTFAVASIPNNQILQIHFKNVYKCMFMSMQMYIKQGCHYFEPFVRCILVFVSNGFPLHFSNISKFSNITKSFLLCCKNLIIRDLRCWNKFEYNVKNRISSTE